MIDNDGLAAWLRLTLIPGIGGETQRKLLAAFGLPEAIFAAGRLATRAIAGDRADLLFDFDPSEEVDRNLSWAAQPGQHIITLADAEYPKALLEIADPPTVLYVRGNPSLLHKRGLAVVGVFSFEVAETKVAQVMDFARRHQHPLQCTMEKE